MRVLALTLLVLFPLPARARKAVPRVGVVSTRADLLSRPPVELPDGGRVRLGLSARTCPRNFGVLLYVLLAPEPVRSNGERNRAPGRTVGPVLVDVHAADEEIGEARQLLAETSPGGDPRRHRLHATAILAAGKNGTTVRVTTRTGKLLAKATLPTAEPTDETWVALRASVEGEGFRVCGAAIPGIVSGYPIEEFDAGDADSIPLPPLVPDRTDEGLTITRSESGLRVESKPEIVVTRPEDHLLLRILVNGEEVAPASASAERAYSGSDRLGRRIDLPFDVGSTGAQTGDRIEIELLHCPGGVVTIGAGPRASLLEEAREPCIPRRSNRLVFVLR